MIRTGEQLDTPQAFDAMVRGQLLEFADVMLYPPHEVWLLSHRYDAHAASPNESISFQFRPYPDWLHQYQLDYVGQRRPGYHIAHIDDVGISQTHVVKGLTYGQIQEHLASRQTGIKPDSISKWNNFNLSITWIVSTPYGRQPRRSGHLINRVIRTQIFEVVAGQGFGDYTRTAEIPVAYADREVHIPQLLGRFGLNNERTREKIKIDQQRILGMFTGIGWPIESAIPSRIAV